MKTIVLGCTGKKQFPNYKLASTSAKRLRDRDRGAHVEPYHCTHCNRFHVGEARGHGRPDKRKEPIE